MKLLIGFLFFSSFQLFSQSYLNILLSNGDYKNSRLDSLQKITLSSTGDVIYFHQVDGYIAIENIANIKTFTFSDTAQGQSIPVELSSFNVMLIGSSVLLKWRTETELNNYGFEIERASESNGTPRKWDKIGFVEGSGNSTSPQEYSFNDKPIGDNTYLYRLKQIDTDGRYEYSDIISIDIKTPNQYALHQNYPNPFNPITSITYNLPKDEMVLLKVYDMLGSEVVTLVSEIQKPGTYTIPFEAVGMASGIYICRISAGNFKSTIKMMLTK